MEFRVVFLNVGLPMVPSCGYWCGYFGEVKVEV